MAYNNCVVTGCEYRDIGFLIDSSGSIVEADSFELMKRFINRVVGRLDIGPSRNLVGLVQYSETVISVFNFSTYANRSKAEIIRAVDEMAPLDANTNTALGLRYFLLLYPRSRRHDADA